MEFPASSYASTRETPVSFFHSNPSNTDIHKVLCDQIPGSKRRIQYTCRRHEVLTGNQFVDICRLHLSSLELGCQSLNCCCCS
jgi:hypothetical protein